MNRDTNFQHAEIVRSKKHRTAPSGVQEQCHFREPGEICHCISDITCDGHQGAMSITSPVWVVLSF